MDLPCRPKARFSVDIRKSLYTKVVLEDSVTMFQGIGEQMPNACNVSYDEDFCFRNGEGRSQHGHEVGPS